MDLIDSWRQSRCPVAGLPSHRAALVLAAYMGILALGGALLPGRVYEGTLLTDGTRVKYKCNGLQVLGALLVGLTAGCAAGIFQPTVVADMSGELFATMLLAAFLLTGFLYVDGRRSRSSSASLRPRVTGNPLHDWWFGVQLNPQVLGQDLKLFCLKAGMIGWLLINLSVAAKQLRRDSAMHLDMALYQLFAMIYVVDFFWHEPYMFTTWDVMAENFGFMLVFGDLVWIPFTFSIQAWWLLAHPQELSAFSVAVIVGVFGIGFAIFRGSNKQKHDFKKDPNVRIWGRPARTIGGRLLISGYWGVSRHCNYLGDLLVALSFSLPCGLRSVVPYVYPIYLVILLLWRERRDEARCRDKYKETWAKYCRAVPWRIFPFIY